MSDDGADGYAPSFQFTCPPASSAIENTFRMGQVLQKKDEPDEAIKKYLAVCDALERVVTLNPSANVDVRLAIFSLGHIADIYHSREDWDKSLAFRECQQGFLDYINHNHHVRLDDDAEEADAVPDFYQVTSQAAAYRRLFERVRAAKELKERPPVEKPEEMMRRYREALVKEEQDRNEKLVRMLNEGTHQHEMEIRNSPIKRNLQRIIDHPIVFMVMFVFVRITIATVLQMRPKKKLVLPEGLDAKMDFLERVARQQKGKNSGKPTRERTTRPTYVEKEETQEKRSDFQDL
jgi:tetratricopeptide (TPR) repeat protein